MATYCVRLEDLSHLWITSEDSPILRRVRLLASLEDREARILSTADPERPVQIQIEEFGWSRDAFDANLIAVHAPPPKPLVRRRRVPAPMVCGAPAH